MGTLQGERKQWKLLKILKGEQEGMESETHFLWELEFRICYGNSDHS
jgi:hypothetical protein